MNISASDLAGFIDHTLLAPDATAGDIDRLCDEAVQYGFGAVCVAPVWLGLVTRRLRDSATRIVTVVGFPHGNTLPAAKAHETSLVLQAGAQEVDMVLQIGALKSGDADTVLADIAAVVAAAKERRRALVKVIIETALLANEEKVLACKLAAQAGADYVKTSTGYGPGGATAKDVALMRRVVGDRLGVKAAGGIKTLQTALEMIVAGASRLGCSSSVAIMNELSGPAPE